MIDIRFCYKIAAEAKMARDTVTGEPVETYMQVKFGGAKKPPEDNDKMHQETGVAIAEEMKIDPSWVIPISEEEYDMNTLDEEDDYVEE